MQYDPNDLRAGISGAIPLFLNDFYFLEIFLDLQRNAPSHQGLLCALDAMRRTGHTEAAHCSSKPPGSHGNIEAPVASRLS